MGILLYVVSILTMVGGLIFIGSDLLKETPIYLKSFFFFAVISMSLAFGVLGLGLDSIMKILRKTQNQLREMQRDINSPFGKPD